MQAVGLAEENTLSGGFMLRFCSVLSCVILMLLTLSSHSHASASAENVSDRGGYYQVVREPLHASAAPQTSPLTVIFDNGPLVNSPGTGAGGADESVLQNVSLGMGTLGFGNQVANNNRVADDFTLSSTANIGAVVFYGYQTGSTTTSTITSVNYQIWDGPPGQAGSSVVFGDTTTNRLLHSEFSNAYRVTETTHGDAGRPIMRNVVSAGVTLGPGTYWIDWQTDGTLGSGPWVPPVTITGQTTTGNAMQSVGGTWNSITDGGTDTPQGLPFQLVSLGAYVIDISNSNLVTFELTTPGTFDVIGNIGSHYFFSGDFVNGDMSKIYAIDYNSNQLFSINTSTAAQTVIGPSMPYGSEIWTGMTASQTGTVYVSSTDISASSLYTIDITTGSVTRIGPITNAACIIDIAINTSGQMYGFDICSDSLISIDPATGAGTVIGPAGFDGNYAQGMDFDDLTGILYLAAFNNGTFSGELRTVNLSTGSTTLVGPFQGNVQADCLAIASFGAQPPANTPPVVSGVGVSADVLSWTYVDADADPQASYEAAVCPTSPCTSASADVIWSEAASNANTSTTIATTLIKGSTYYAAVRANDGTAWSVWAETSFDWSVNNPPAVSGVGVSADVLIWTYTDADADPQAAYEAVVCENSPCTAASADVLWSETASNANTSTTITATLIMGATYYTAVRANDGTDWSAWTEAAFAWGVNNPPTSDPVAVSDTTVSWTYHDIDSDPQSGFEVEVRTGAGGSGTLSWSTSGAGTQTSVPVTAALLFGQTYFVRVRVNDGTAWGAWSETSFRYAGAAGLITPNGGEEIPTGSTSRISWDFTPFFDGITPSVVSGVKYKLFLSLDNGASWSRLAGGLTGSSYDWYVPAQWNNKRRSLVKVVAVDAAGTKVASDRSDTRFTVQVVKLTAPDGGAVTGGGITNITWDTFLTMRPVTLTTLQYNCGAGWKTIGTVSGNPGSYSWSVPSSLAGTGCRVKVILRDRTHMILGSDPSNEFFEVK